MISQKKIQQLSAPFAESDVEWTPTHTYPRNPTSIGDYNIYCSPFISREAKILRLNTVIGLGNWQTDLRALGAKGMLSGIALLNESNEWAWYWDGAAYDNKNDNNDIDSVKMINTQAFKRSTELLGIGLYLKKFSEKANLSTKWSPGATGIRKKNIPNSLNVGKLYWTPPMLPSRLLPVYLTPEQYHLLTQYDGCVDDALQREVSEMINAYDKGTYDATKYNVACDLIRRIQDDQRNPGSASSNTKPTGRGNPPPPQKTQGKGNKKTQHSYTDPRFIPAGTKDEDWQKLLDLVQSITSATMPEQEDIMQVKRAIVSKKMTADRVPKAIEHLEKVKENFGDLPF